MSVFAAVAIAVTVGVAAGSFAIALRALATRRAGRVSWRGVAVDYRSRAAVFGLWGTGVLLLGIGGALDDGGDGRAGFVVQAIGFVALLADMALMTSAQRRNYPAE